MALIQDYEEKLLLEKLVGYYHRIHEDVKFTTREAQLTPEGVREVYLTFPGFEEEATFEQRVHEIKKAVSYGYSTPVILMEKKDKLILIDGHRRLRVAFELGLAWRAYIITPDKEADFGIEKQILGKASAVWGKK
jgi:hypothetical protein